MKFNSKKPVAKRLNDEEFSEINVKGKSAGRRFFSFITLLPILILALYSAWWYYTTNQLKEIISQELKNYSEVKYTSISKTGFPLRIGLNIVDVSVDMQNQTVVGVNGSSKKPGFGLGIQGPIKIAFDVIGNKADVLIPSPINFKVAGNEIQWTAQENIKLDITSHEIIGKYFVTGFDDLKKKIDEVLKIKWVIKASVPEGKAVSGDEEMYKSGVSKFELSFNPANNENAEIKLLVEGIGNEYLPGYYNYMRKEFENISSEMGDNPQIKAAVEEFINSMIERSKLTQKSSIRFDASYTGPYKNDNIQEVATSDFKLKINQIALRNVAFAVNMDADFSKTGNEEPLPIGYVRLSLIQYKVLLDFFFGWMGSYSKLEAANANALAGKNYPSIFNETSKKNITALLEKLGKKINDNDIQLIVKRDKGQNFFLNDIPMEQVMQDVLPALMPDLANMKQNNIPAQESGKAQ